MTQEEITERINALETEILRKKNVLADTDYKVIKVAEGVDTESEDVKQLRADARKAINDAQDEIARLKAMTPDEPVMDNTVGE